MSRDDRPARYVVALNALASDTIDLEIPVKAINASADEAITIVDLSDNTITNYQLHKGYNPVGIKRIFATGLTANFWGLDKAFGG